MKAHIFVRLATLRFGNQWQTPLAARLDVATRTLQRYADGTRGIPDDFAARFCRALIDDGERIAQEGLRHHAAS